MANRQFLTFRPFLDFLFLLLPPQIFYNSFCPFPISSLPSVVKKLPLSFPFCSLSFSILSLSQNISFFIYLSLLSFPLSASLGQGKWQSLPAGSQRNRPSFVCLHCRKMSSRYTQQAQYRDSELVCAEPATQKDCKSASHSSQLLQGPPQSL